MSRREERRRNWEEGPGRRRNEEREELQSWRRPGQRGRVCSRHSKLPPLTPLPLPGLGLPEAPAAGASLLLLPPPLRVTAFLGRSTKRGGGRLGVRGLACCPASAVALSPPGPRLHPAVVLWREVGRQPHMTFRNRREAAVPSRGPPPRWLETDGRDAQLGFGDRSHGWGLLEDGCSADS